MPRQNTSPADYPQAVLQQIEQLALNIAIARKRRKETQAQWAKKLGVSQPTFARIERGDPGVAMASYVMCMWLINPAVGLADLIAPPNDRAALEREVAKASQRTRKVQKPGNGSNNAASFEKHGEVREPQPGLAADAVQRASQSLAGIQKAIGNAPGKSNATASGLAALLLKTQESTK